MHRILSYQTAVRASSARDVREYVTKRTCVSLILSIAFFTLISGFLLGKFVADRQRHIRELQDQDITLAKHLHALQKILIDAAANVSQSTFEVPQFVANERIHDKFITCMVKGDKPNTTEPVITFMEKIVDLEFIRLTDCLTNLSGFLEQAVKKTLQ